MFTTFREFKKAVTDDRIKCDNLRKHLSNLCRLFGLWELYTNSQDNFDIGYFTPGTMKLV